MSLYKLKASFTASALDYGADSVDNSLKAEGLSQTSSAIVAQNSSLALDGALATSASSGFASPHRITITSTGDDSSGAIFVITGTDANSGAQTVEIQGGAAGKTVTTAESFKTVSSITVKNGSADTAGTVSAGIASILEGDTGNNQKATYTITATDFPSSTTLTLNLSSTATAVFNYGTANESTSRDFTDADEGTPITVTVLAAQDSTDELNPHMPTITHAIYEGSNVATAYVGEIADITVAVQDNNVPTASDGIVQTAKQEDNIVSALSSGVVDTTNGLTIATGTFTKAHKVTITSTGNDSGITYTIVGTDANGSAQTETSITGATAGNTATSTNLFKTITSIKPVGGPSADTVKAGIYPQITFAASDFGYLDADGDLLNKITINTLPTSGELKKGSTVLTSSNLSSNNVLTAKELADGDLVFTPAVGGSGSGYGNFTYTVNDGLQDAASANTMKVNIGDAVDVTVTSWKQVSSADVPVKNQTVTLKSGANYHDGVAVSGTFTTNDTGKLDLTGVADGTHTAGYTIAKNTSYAITQQALEMTDVLDIYDFFVGARTPTADQVVASNVTWATAGDTVLGMDDVLTAYDMFVGKDGADAYVILRDASAGTATYNAGTTQITNASSSFEIQAGNSMTLQAYFLGDTDGGYTTPLLA